MGKNLMEVAMDESIYMEIASLVMFVIRLPLYGGWHQLDVG